MKITSAMAGLNVHSDTFVACCTIAMRCARFSGTQIFSNF